jgi:hypothetical protein
MCVLPVRRFVTTTMFSGDNAHAAALALICRRASNRTGNTRTGYRKEEREEHDSCEGRSLGLSDPVHQAGNQHPRHETAIPARAGPRKATGLLESAGLPTEIT